MFHRLWTSNYLGFVNIMQGLVLLYSKARKQFASLLRYKLISFKPISKFMLISKLSATLRLSKVTFLSKISSGSSKYLTAFLKEVLNFNGNVFYSMFNSFPASPSACYASWVLHFSLLLHCYEYIFVEKVAKRWLLVFLNFLSFFSISR